MTNDTLTKRELFAGMAMQGLIAAQPEEVEDRWDRSRAAAFATLAVEHADALIAALGGQDALVPDWTPEAPTPSGPADERA